MCSESLYIAGRYNKYLRNLSQSPWIDKDDVRIKDSVQELIEDGLKKYLQFGKSVFSSSGREDVDVRMLGKGRPFVFRIVNPFDLSKYNQKTMLSIQNFVNEKHVGRVKIRDLQVVTKEDVTKHIKDGEESKTKQYRALCCCSRELTKRDIDKVAQVSDLHIDQRTPIRVLHRRTLAVRRRKIYNMSIEDAKVEEFDSAKPEDSSKLFVLSLLTEAGTYIKEFVHGDFGRTEPSLSSILGDCDTDLMELDVMEVYLDWPPALDETSTQLESRFAGAIEQKTTIMTEENLVDVYKLAIKHMKEAEKMPRGDARQDSYIKARKGFETAQSLVNSLSLFSDNETIDDVPTSDIRYLLIPAYLAKITLSSECGPNRLATFKRAESLLVEFLTQVASYGIERNAIEKVLDSSQSEDGPGSNDLESAMRNRTKKIESFRQAKLLEEKIQELDRRINSGQQVDEADERDYHVSLLNKWTSDSIDSLKGEVRPSLMFETNLPRDGPSNPRAVAPGKPIKPITIVKDELQKHVFGLGYPSRPTVTVDEFINKKIQDGDLAFHAQKEVYGNSLQRYAEKPDLRRQQEELSDEERERKEEHDDPEEIERKRRWDEFKDDNPRGSGNRHNMG